MEGSEEGRERETGRVVNMASGGEFRFKDTHVLEEGLARLQFSWHIMQY